MSDSFHAAVLSMVVGSSIPEERVTEPNQVPALPDYPYVVASTVPADPAAYLLSAQHGARVYRVILQAFARTMDGCLDFTNAAVNSLLDLRPVVTGYTTGPCRVEVSGSPVPDPDDNRVIGLTTTLTFTAVKEI